MPYRCDFYSDEEYQQACTLEEEQYKEQLALEEYQQECAYQEYLREVQTMTDKKLTDSEIIKALECCNKNDCKECPYGKYNIIGWCCMPKVRKDALDLINHLQAENEKLQIVKKHIDTLIHRGVEHPTAETYERAFKKALEQLYDNTNAKAEAYKECIEKAKREIDHQPHSKSLEASGERFRIKQILDNLLKELVGE